jgi:hypothetical protein
LSGRLAFVKAVLTKNMAVHTDISGIKYRIASKVRPELEHLFLEPATDVFLLGAASGRLRGRQLRTHSSWGWRAAAGGAIAAWPESDRRSHYRRKTVKKSCGILGICRYDSENNSEIAPHRMNCFLRGPIPPRFFYDADLT